MALSIGGGIYIRRIGRCFSAPMARARFDVASGLLNWRASTNTSLILPAAPAGNSGIDFIFMRI